jgi:hypothetical protein
MVDRRALLAAYGAAQQRGNTGVYGGPPPSRRTTPPKQRPMNQSVKDVLAELDAMAAAQKQGADQSRRVAAADSLGKQNPFERGLGTVFGGAAQALGFLGRGSVAIQDELSQTPLGAAQRRLTDNPFGQAAAAAISPISTIQSRIDPERTAADERSFTDKLTDVEYGFGQVAKSTGSKWGDRLQGFAGDVGLDPLSYVGGAATKAAVGTNRLGREAMAATLREAGFSDEVIGSASRYGAAYLDDAAREVVGVKQPGLYFGVGEQAVAVPGSRRIGAALEKGFASTRVRAVSPLTNKANMALRTVDDLKEARTVMNAGRTLNGVTPSMAAARIKFHNDVKAAAKTFIGVQGRQIDAILRQLDDDTAKSMTDALENGAADAAVYRQIYEGLYEAMEKAGVDVGKITKGSGGPIDYVPHRWTREGILWLRDDPLGRQVAAALEVNPTADPSAVMSRVIKGGSEIKVPNGKPIKIPEKGTIKEINDALSAIGAPKMLEDDLRVLTHGYLREVGSALGLRQAWTNLSKNGGDIVRRLDEVGINELDELASITANKEMGRVLDRAVKGRAARKAKRIVEAQTKVEAFRKELSTALDTRLKAIGDEVVAARSSLKSISDELKKDAPNPENIQKQFDEMRQMAQVERERILTEMYEVEETIEALTAARFVMGDEATSLATQPSRAERAAAIQRARLLDELEGTKTFEEALDEMYADLYEVSAAMRQWDEMLDNPHLIAEEASHLKDDLDISFEVREEEANDWSKRIQAKIETAEAGEEAEALRMLAAAGRYADVSEALGRKQVRLRAELDANVATQKVLRERVAAERAAQNAERQAAEAATPTQGRIPTEEEWLEESLRMNEAARAQLRAQRDSAPATPEINQARRDAATAAAKARAREPRQALAGRDEQWDKELLLRWRTAVIKAGQARDALSQAIRQSSTNPNDSDRTVGKLAALAKTWVDTRRELEALRLSDELADRTPSQISLMKLIEEEDILSESIAAAAEGKKRYAELARRPQRSGNSPSALIAQKEMAERLERNDWWLGQVREKVEEMVTRRVVVKNEGSLKQYADWIDSEINELQNAVERPPVTGRVTQGREVTDDEAAAVTDWLRSTDEAVRMAQREYDQLRNRLAKDYPSPDSQRAQPDGTARWDIQPRDFTYGGVEIEPQALTREEYMKRTAGKPGPTGPRERLRDWRADQEERIARDADPELNEMVESYLDDGLADTTEDVADLDGWTTLNWDDQVESGVARTAHEELQEAVALAKESLRMVKSQRDRTLKSLGLTPNAGEGFAYGKFGNILLVNTKPRVMPNGKLGFTRETAISMTEREMLEEAQKRGLVKGTGRKLKHQELAELLGWRVEKFTPGTAKYDNLPQSLRDSVDRYAAKQRIRGMSPEARLKVNSFARSRQQEEWLNNRAIVRALEQEKRDVMKELDVIEETKAVVRELRDTEAARVDEITERIGGLHSAADTLRQRRAATEAQQNAAAAERVTQAGKQQVQQQEVGNAVARGMWLEKRAAALDAAEKQIGKLEADELRRLDVDRSIKGMKQGLAQSEVWRVERSERVMKDLKGSVPKKLQKGATGRAIRSQYDQLDTLMKAAAKDGGPELNMAATLAADAQKAVLRMEREGDFIESLQKMRSRAAKGSKKDATDRLVTVERLAIDGFDQIQSAVFPEGADYAVASEMNRMLSNFTREFRDEPEWLKYYDEATTFFKTWATTSVGFHVRNFMSASFMNMTEGVGVAAHVRALREWQDYVRATKEGDAATAAWWNGLDDNQRSAFSAVFGSGAGGNFSAAEIGDKLIARGGALRDNPITRLSQRLGQDWVEGPVRLALANTYVGRGADTNRALAAISTIHFDYSEVSNFDRKMKRIIPFWTFMSRNLPLQVEQMWKKPKAYAIFNHARDNADVSEDGEVVPKWMSDMGGFPIARNIGPIFGGDDVVLTPDLAHLNAYADVRDWTETPSQIVSSMAPQIKVPYELMANKSSFFGGPLFREGEDTLKNKIDYAARSFVPPYATSQRLLGQGRYENQAGEKRLNWVGIPTRGVGDRERANELYRRAMEG